MYLSYPAQYEHNLVCSVMGNLNCTECEKGVKTETITQNSAEDVPDRLQPTETNGSQSSESQTSEQDKTPDANHESNTTESVEQPSRRSFQVVYPDNRSTTNTASGEMPDLHVNGHDSRREDIETPVVRSVPPWQQPAFVKRQIVHCVREMLGVICKLVESNAEPPLAMVRLNKIADKVDNGWVRVMECLVTEVPLDNPLGPAVINLLVDECPLPTKHLVQTFCESYGVNKLGAQAGKGKGTRKHRNLCVILGCLAEKMAGPGSVQWLTDDVFEFLAASLSYRCDPCVILHALIALEKFAQTTENKVTILKKFGTKKDTNPLLHLENKLSSKRKKLRKIPEDYLYLELDFCVRWSLTNLFVVQDREVKQHGLSGINVMLNSEDVSEYLKLAPNGLQARCDASSFESVRCTYQVYDGVWYYEVEIITVGVMQIGWATKDSKFLNHEGYGIGDDEYSLAYDGCRQLIWHNAQSVRHSQQPWQPGDVLGCLLNIDEQYVLFFLNGVVCEQQCDHLFRHKSGHMGFFAAASFMSFQQCKFNFGADKFAHKPSIDGLRTFNSCAELTPEQKQNICRPRARKVTHDIYVPEDACIVCYDQTADTTLNPCKHNGLCWTCAQQLDQCPHCRVPICLRTAPGKEDISRVPSQIVCHYSSQEFQELPIQS